MSKKGLALTLAALMVWAFAVPAFGQVEPFPDVPHDHWAYEAVEALRLAGLIEGYPDGTFSGERTFTRYEMAMVFSRILERLVAWLEGREALLISAATGEVIAALADEFSAELTEMGVDSADLAGVLAAMNARIQSLTAQVESLIAIANAAQAEAEAAAEAAARAEDRAYRARLAAESARTQASEASQVANRALAIAAMSVGLDEAELGAMSAQEAVEAAREAAARAAGVAAGAAAEDARRALAEAETASERAYRARLAAQQARALAEEAKEIAERGAAIAEMAYYSEETQQALEAAEQASDRAYRARLAAEDARAQARQAREVAERALAIAELAGPGALEEAVAAVQAVEQARQAVQRAQRLAAEAESAAMIADAKADLAREEAAASYSLAQEAYQLASDAMNEARRQGEMARAEAREALEAAQAADRLAFLALFTAEQALVRLDEVEPQVAELRARPVLGGEFRVDFEETHTSDPANGVPSDPRNYRSSKIRDESAFEASVALNATVEPAEDVVVTGGIKLASDVFGASTDTFKLSNLYLSVTTPGVIRSAYFGSGVTAAQATQGFSKYVLHADGYGNPRGGAVVDTQLGDLSTRFVAARGADASDNIFGIASSLPLADGMNVGFSYAYTDAAHRAAALQLHGETGGLAYDWTYALFRDETAIEGHLSTALGSLELGFDYYAVDESFGADAAGSLGKELDYDDDGIEAGRTAYTLSAGLPFSFGKAVYEKGYDALLADPESDFTDYHLAGLEELNVLGFGLSGHFYVDQRDSDRKTQANRIEVSRTFELGLPVTFSFMQASANIEGWAGHADDPGWTTRSARSIGVAVNDYALTETVTVNAGYKTETNPISDSWTEPAQWISALTADDSEKFEIDKRDTISASVSLAATEALTLKAGFERAQHQTTHASLGEVDVARTTVDLGADYTLSMYGADVTLGYAYQARTFSEPFAYDASPRSTYSVSVSRQLFGGTVDAAYKLIAGRGTDSKAKTEARDVVASLDYTYPFAEDFEFKLSGKWGSSTGNNEGAYVDGNYSDGYYASVKAGLGLKF